MYISFNIYTCCFYNLFFCLNLNFLNNTRDQVEIFLTLFLNFISLFSLILYLNSLNPNNKRHFVNNGDRKEF